MLRFGTSLYTYKSRRGDQRGLGKRIREITEARLHYGYRRIHVLLRREGWPVNVKRVYRLYREQALQLRRKVPERRVKARLRAGRTVAIRVNQVWSMDFVHDQLATGRKIRVLTIVDTFSRYSPAVDPRFRYRGEDVVQTLERVCQAIGYPQAIRVDLGSEFVSRDLDLWAYTNSPGSVLMCPLSQPDRDDAPRLTIQLVPDLAAMSDDIVILKRPGFSGGHLV